MYFEDWEIANLIKYQVGALLQFTKEKNLQHVKPHGALYNKASYDSNQANAIVKSIKEIDPEIIHVVLAGSVWENIAQKSGVKIARECFADRAITAEGKLVPRNLKGAIITEEEVIIERVVKVAETGIMDSIDGTPVKILVDTLCLHGDNPNSVKLASMLRQELESVGIILKSMHTFVE